MSRGRPKLSSSDKRNVQINIKFRDKEIEDAEKAGIGRRNISGIVRLLFNKHVQSLLEENDLEDEDI